MKIVEFMGVHLRTDFVTLGISGFQSRTRWRSRGTEPALSLLLATGSRVKVRSFLMKKRGYTFLWLIVFQIASIGGVSFSRIESDQAGKNWGQSQGLGMFRGNPLRNFYGTGGFSRVSPQLKWRYPERPMCASFTFFR